MYNRNAVKFFVYNFLIINELNTASHAGVPNSRIRNGELFATKNEKKRSADPQISSNLSLDPEGFTNMMGQTPGNMAGIIGGNNLGTITNTGDNSPINQVASLGMINGSPMNTGMLSGSNPMDQLGSLGNMGGMINGSNPMDQLGSLGNMGGMINRSNPMNQLGSLGNMGGMINGSNPMGQLGSLGNMSGMIDGNNPMNQLGSLGLIGGNNVGTILNTGDNSPINQVATLGMINGSPLSSISGMLNGSSSMDQLGSMGGMMNEVNPVKQIGSLSGSSNVDPADIVGGSNILNQIGSMGNSNQIINGNLPSNQVTVTMGGSNPGQIVSSGNNNPINQTTNFLQQFLLNRNQVS